MWSHLSASPSGDEADSSLGWASAFGPPSSGGRGGADQQAGAGDACGRVLLGQRPRGKRKSFFVFRNSNDLLLIIKIIFFAMKIRVKKIQLMCFFAMKIRVKKSINVF